MRLERITRNGGGPTRSANSSPRAAASLIRALEPVWLVLVVVFGLYKALGLFVPLPALPTEF